ncbi:ABC transporter ATP-binding protein [Tropicimonas marinistellae]|uniref:ABC transporter ATP-binding protein n=1 Tax=Tropicimonas marinistellae TaxID=1739787 RepID=UPI000830F3E0|nr:ABC transporter ATP-binding protein [Tropicimonas marinistellae]
MKGPVMHARGIRRRFGKTQALDGVDLTLEDGAFVALLGPAGAGKTTFLRICAGLEVPDAGHIEIRNQEATALEPRDRDVAMIFDSLALYPDKTGFENIAAPLRIRNMDAASIEDLVHDIARTLHVPHILGRPPKTMSGGERQRIALGRALVRNPAFFLLDEPLSSLDAQLRIELRAELRRLQRERGASFLYATPDFTEAMAVADRLVILLDGRVRQVGTPQEVYDNPVDRDVARFVGAPEINLCPAEYDPGQGGHIRIAGKTMPAIDNHKTIFNGACARFDAGLRPENVRVLSAGSGPGNAIVLDSEPLGLRAALSVDTGEGVFRATIPEHDSEAFAVGQPVNVEFDIGQCLCFDADTGVRLGRPQSN